MGVLLGVCVSEPAARSTQSRSAVSVGLSPFRIPSAGAVAWIARRETAVGNCDAPPRAAGVSRARNHTRSLRPHHVHVGVDFERAGHNLGTHTQLA